MNNKKIIPWHQLRRSLSLYLKKKEAKLSKRQKQLLLLLYIMLFAGCLLYILLQTFSGSPIRVLLPILPTEIL